MALLYLLDHSLHKLEFILPELYGRLVFVKKVFLYSLFFCVNIGPTLPPLIPTQLIAFPFLGYIRPQTEKKAFKTSLHKDYVLFFV